MAGEVGTKTALSHVGIPEAGITFFPNLDAFDLFEHPDRNPIGLRTYVDDDKLLKTSILNMVLSENTMARHIATGKPEKIGVMYIPHESFFTTTVGSAPTPESARTILEAAATK